MISGIYFIEALAGVHTGWKYIGQSVDVNKRRATHFRELEKNIHANGKLQRYYNKYGKSALDFGILGEYSEDVLDFWEDFFIQAFDSQKDGFNILDKHGHPGFVGKGGCLFNTQTGETVSFENASKFTRTYGLKHPNHVSEVLTGKRYRIGDWCLPGKAQIHRLISPHGDRIMIPRGKVERFCQQNNMSLGTLWDVLQNKRKHYRGWRLDQQ